MRFKTAISSILGFSLVMSLCPVPSADAALLYASGSSNMNTPIYTVDTATGTQTTLGNSGLPNVQSLAFSPTGVLYGTSTPTGGQPSLITINQTTGAATPVVSITPGANTNTLLATTGLAFDSTGNLYLVGRDFNQAGTLYTLNPATGVATGVGPSPTTGAVQVQDMAIAPNGTAFAVNAGSASPTRGVRTLDLTTGNTTFLGPTGGSSQQLTSMTFTPDGTLWVGGAGFLYTADTTSGALTQQYSGLATYHALALAPVPVPAALWLFGSGLAGVAAFARRRTTTKS